MTYTEVTITYVAPRTLVGLSAIAPRVTQENIGPVVGPLFPRVIHQLAAANLRPAGAGVAYYTPDVLSSEDVLRVHVAFPVAVDSVPGLERVELPAARVASVIHRGGIGGADAAYRTLRTWAREKDHSATGAAREIYLEAPDDEDEWVTEIQLELSSPDVS